MGVVLLPQGVRRQPQVPVPLARKYSDAVLVSLCSGTPSRDLSGRGNHLSSGTQPTTVYRNQGRVLNFDGATQGVSTVDSLTPGAKFTVLAWVTPAAVHTNYNRIINTSHSDGWNLGSFTDGSYAWMVHTVDGTPLNACAGGQQVVGKRDFLCGVFDGTNCWLYINGVQAASCPGTAPTLVLPIQVGYSSGFGQYWNGDIDTVAVFNRVLPASEIWSLYQNPWQLLSSPTRSLFFPDSSPPPPSGGYGFIKVSGSWKTLSGTYVKVAGVWKSGHFSPKISGSWKSLV